MIRSNDNINFVITLYIPSQILSTTKNAVYFILLYKKILPQMQKDFSLEERGKSFFFSNLFI